MKLWRGGKKKRERKRQKKKGGGRKKGKNWKKSWGAGEQGGEARGAYYALFIGNTEKRGEKGKKAKKGENIRGKTFFKNQFWGRGGHTMPFWLGIQKKGKRKVT